MERMGDWEHGGAEAVCVKPLAECLDGAGLACDNRLQRRIMRGYHQAVTVQFLQHFIMAGPDGDHGAGPISLIRHCSASSMDDANHFLLRTGAGPAQGRNLAQTVSDRYCALHAKHAEHFEASE